MSYCKYSFAKLETSTTVANSVVKAGAWLNKEPQKSIEEIKQELGLDRIKPVELSKDDQVVFDEEGNTFADLYEEELRRFYES